MTAVTARRYSSLLHCPFVQVPNVCEIWALLTACSPCFWRHHLSTFEIRFLRFSCPSLLRPALMKRLESRGICRVHSLRREEVGQGVMEVLRVCVLAFVGSRWEIRGSCTSTTYRASATAQHWKEPLGRIGPPRRGGYGLFPQRAGNRRD
jgi:hypothetical protein